MGAEQAELALLGIDVPPLGSVKDRILRSALQKKKRLAVFAMKYFSFITILNKGLDEKQIESVLGATSEMIREIFGINTIRDFEVALDPSKRKEYEQEDQEIAAIQKEKPVPQELESTFEFVKSLSKDYDQFDGDLKNLARAKKQFKVQRGAQTPMQSTPGSGSFFSPAKTPKLWDKMKKVKE